MLLLLQYSPAYAEVVNVTIHLTYNRKEESAENALNDVTLWWQHALQGILSDRYQLCYTVLSSFLREVA